MFQFFFLEPHIDSTPGSDRKGGALRAMRGLSATSLSFSQCYSAQPGAALAAGGDVEVQEATFEACNSEMLSVAWLGPIVLSQMGRRSATSDGKAKGR